jgi:hypothetical protein
MKTFHTILIGEVCYSSNYLPISSQQPQGKEMVIDEIRIAILGDEILIKKSFGSRHHTAG